MNASVKMVEARSERVVVVVVDGGNPEVGFGEKKIPFFIACSILQQIKLLSSPRHSV